jgi:hypothetical protein
MRKNEEAALLSLLQDTQTADFALKHKFRCIFNVEYKIQSVCSRSQATPLKNDEGCNMAEDERKKRSKGDLL